MEYTDELLNKALELATEWGENFRQPIHGRVRVEYPDLSDGEIDDLTALVSKAESRIYQLAEERNAGALSEGDVFRVAREEFRWINEANLGRLSNIGMYYANR